MTCAGEGLCVEVVDSLKLVGRHPFGAGALVFRGGRVVLTLEEAEGAAGLCLRGVGGGQEAGETPWDTAVREAREEIGSALRVVEPLGSLRWDGDPGVCVPVRDEASPPVLILGRKRRASSEPYKPGLPGGWHLYLPIYLAQTLDPLVPGEEQHAVVLVPPDRLGRFQPGGDWAVDEVLKWGVEVRWRGGAAPRGVRVTLPVWEELVPCAVEALGRGLVPQALMAR